MTFNGTGLTVRSAIRPAAPATVVGAVSLSLAPVAVSVIRSCILPVVRPGLMTLPAIAAPRLRRKAMVVGRPAGAVVTPTTAVLPAMPSRLGSAVLGGKGVKTCEGTAAKAGALV